MSKTLTLREANQTFSRCVREVEAGEEITITRHGRPVARLVPAQVRDVEKARQAARDLLDMRKEVRPDPEGLTIRDYIEMGRRY